jgi:hypothetical protein
LRCVHASMEEDDTVAAPRRPAAVLDQQPPAQVPIHVHHKDVGLEVLDLAMPFAVCERRHRYHRPRW